MSRISSSGGDGFKPVKAGDNITVLEGYTYVNSGATNTLHSKTSGPYEIVGGTLTMDSDTPYTPGYDLFLDGTKVYTSSDGDDNIAVAVPPSAAETSFTIDVFHGGGSGANITSRVYIR